MNDFNVQPAQFDFGQGGQLGGLTSMMGGMGQQQAPNAFASQTPGAPQQPGRVDASSFGGGGEGGMDPFMMLMQNIAKSFGGA